MSDERFRHCPVPPSVMWSGFVYMWKVIGEDISGESARRLAEMRNLRRFA